MLNYSRCEESVALLEIKSVALIKKQVALSESDRRTVKRRLVRAKTGGEVSALVDFLNPFGPARCRAFKREGRNINLKESCRTDH
jgi:hypothetical protein